jgi:hypothetical protein
MYLLLYQKDGQNIKPQLVTLITTMRQRKLPPTLDLHHLQRPQLPLLLSTRLKAFYNTSPSEMRLKMVIQLPTAFLPSSNFKAGPEVDFMAKEAAAEDMIDRGTRVLSLRINPKLDMPSQTASLGYWFTRSMADALCTTQKKTRVSGGYRTS